MKIGDKVVVKFGSINSKYNKYGPFTIKELLSLRIWVCSSSILSVPFHFDPNELMLQERQKTKLEPSDV